MPAVPAFLLKKLYAKNSLKSDAGGFSFGIKNTLSPGVITRLAFVQVDGQKVPPQQLTIVHKGVSRPAHAISSAQPLVFNLNDEATIQVAGHPLQPGVHNLVVAIAVKDVGELKIQIEDRL